MKKIWNFIRNALLSTFVVVMLLFTTICIVIASPFRWMQYRKTHFYRETGVPFRIGIMDHFTFVLYELIQREKLPIRYLMPKDPKRPCDGFFLAGTTLLIHDLPGICYEEQLGGWTAYPEDEEPLTDTVAEILLHLRTDHPDAQITDVRILMDFDGESDESRAIAEENPLFLIYNELEDLPELLRSSNII